MKRRFIVGIRILGIVLIAHALMLIGADEITTIESGGVRTIRSFERILTLYGADAKAWEMILPAPLARTVMMIMSLPGWAVLAAVGGVLALLTRARD